MRGEESRAMAGSHRVWDRGLVRVLVVDDHAVIRAAVRELLRAPPDLRLVGEAADGQSAVILCLLGAPDVVLMDLRMPRMGGIDAIRRILATTPETRIVAWTGYHDPDLTADARLAGAEGPVFKDAPADELLRALRDPEKDRCTPCFA
jgi:DNA-binding NarL/FixJ family response regulator